MPVAAQAHPLGNFTINHLTKLSIGAQRADVRYILDMAEIPTYQALRSEERSQTSPPALRRWADATARTTLPQLQLTVDGNPLPLRLDSASARTRPGAGGLPTLYLKIEAHAALPGMHQARNLSYRDESYPGA